MDELLNNISVLNKETLTFVRLATALADDYESIFVISTEDDSYVEYAAGGKNKELRRRYAGDDFYSDVVVFCNKMVYKDDREVFREKFVKKNVMDAVEGRRSFTFTYRLMDGDSYKYYALKTIRGTGVDDGFIFVGVRNIDEEMRRERRAQIERKTYSDIAGSLATQFEVIYYVDMITGGFTEYSSSKEFAKLGLRRFGRDFFNTVREMCDGIIDPEDMDRVVSALQRGNLLKALKDNNYFTMTYRQMLSGRWQYVDLLAVRHINSPEKVIIGVRNIDEKVKCENAAAEERERYSHIARALASRYEIIYYVNIKTEEYVVYSADKLYTTPDGNEIGYKFFEESSKYITRFVWHEDVEKVTGLLDKQRLIYELEHTGSLTMTFRQNNWGTPQYVTMLAVRPKNDKDHILMGVFNVDAQIRREQKMAAEAESYSEIVMAMAQMYEVIYHVNIETGEYREYSHSEKYSKIGVGVTGRDFFGDTQRNMKRDIYPEDLPMMQEEMKKENLLENLKGIGSYSLNYRLMLDGEPRYVTLFAMKPKADSQHIIIAVANVDSSRKRELAYKAALGDARDMANRDELTGVKNKHAFAQYEMETDKQVEMGVCEDFAVLVADVNGLKRVNDTKGHLAGDEYIKSACKLICTTFKHSPVFRVGGDEFVVMMKGSDLQKSAVLMKQLHDTMVHNIRTGMVTLAAGISFFDSTKDMHVQDVFDRADNAMYEDKKKYHVQQSAIAR
ncbi:GGDEF domain-containing protein [uncultured Ruminococcus sp.]|uniref:GGDEF domain-containing protein n=1 Tax=uncultured Ruminococcus sp. TaxID=165186 RepID=UPI0025E990AC|nr:GGDEF domain-containing protein [uncultured Ruminococcus sp.]